MRWEDPHVFISFSPADDEFGRRLARDLKACGVPVWIDQRGRGRLRWTLHEELGNQAAAMTARLYLVVLSPSAIASERVMGYALSAIERNVRVLPILYQDCEMPTPLRDLSSADLRGEYAPGFRQLLANVRKQVPTPQMARDDNRTRN